MSEREPPLPSEPPTTAATDSEIALEPIAKVDAPVLHNLFELYAHDFSEYVPLGIKSNGRFDIPIEDGWWTRDDHFPFFVRYNGQLSGFVLAALGSRVTSDRDVMDVDEFFVVRGVRRKGVGTWTAHALFATFPGRWEVRVIKTNVPAMKFWSRVIESWLGEPVAGEPFVTDGVDRDLFRFESRPRKIPL
jgi:predicted acetyltransferase